VRWCDVVAVPGPPTAVVLEGGAARRAGELRATGHESRLTSRGDLVIAEVWLTR
jgi:hypothetical protein